MYAPDSSTANTPPAIRPLLHALLKERGAEIEDWFAAQYKGHRVPVYSSVDLRHSGFKQAPVDTNLFPAGFNNLTEHGRERATAAMRAYFAALAEPPARVLLIPESHTRNLPYLDNLSVLLALLHGAGVEARLGRLDLAPGAQEKLTALNGTVLVAEGILRESASVRLADGFAPDVILLNHDLTSGLPEVLNGLATPIVPPPELGWYQRRKSTHFAAYNVLADAFAQQFGLDPWLLSTVIHRCGTINFREKSGLECVALGVERVLHHVREKYAEYGIDHAPYVFIKADAGTYGMGIMTARSGEEVYDINKKIRNKMDVIKEGSQSSEVIIQEGVPTIDTVDSHAAEPLIYLVGGVPVGCIWRINELRDHEGNLNAAGMTFLPMQGDAGGPCCSSQALIARLATLAATREVYGG